MPWLYVLQSEKDGKFYIGQTERSFMARHSEHQNGYVKATKFRKPFLFAYAKEYPTAVEAKKREWYLKQPSGYSEKRALMDRLSSERAHWPIIEHCE